MNQEDAMADDVAKLLAFVPAKDYGRSTATA